MKPLTKHHNKESRQRVYVLNWVPKVVPLFSLKPNGKKSNSSLSYSKLTQKLKRQFKTSDISIPETRAKCIAVAQQIWEGLYETEGKRGI
jgi:hypothetical protein